MLRNCYMMSEKAGLVMKRTVVLCLLCGFRNSLKPLNMLHDDVSEGIDKALVYTIFAADEGV